MNTPKGLILGASLLASAACSSVDNRDTQESTPLSEHAQMDLDVAEAAQHQPVQAIRDACAQEYNDCTQPVDTALAKAALDYAAHDAAIKKSLALERPLYKHVAQEVYRKASHEFNTQTLDCKRALKSCLE